jgi:lactaldehyde dehydrogenase/glycolaldehyde dehydrogenase
MGPLINRQGLESVNRKVRTALSQGASLISGGQIADLPNGFHFQPTVLAGCRADMEIMREEIFGPVLPIQIVDDLEEAIALANDCDYGLTSSIYTRDLSKTLHAMRELDFGETYVNRENFEAMQGFHAGVRKSGIGGADGKHGLYEYTHTHVVYLQG